MGADRQQQLDYIKSVLTATGWTRTDLAQRAGLDPSTLSRFISGHREDHVLREITITRIAQASGVAIVGGSPVVEGFADGEAQLIDFTENSIAANLVAALKAGSFTIDAWCLNSRALENVGYRQGDTLLVRLGENPIPGDVVCAQIYDWGGGKAETVFRIYQPPALIAATNEPSLMRPYLLDSNAVSIKGVVVHSLRSRK